MKIKFVKNKSGKNIPEVLGMTLERAKQISELAARASVIEPSYTAAMDKVVLECKNHSEVAFALFCLGQVKAQNNGKNQQTITVHTIPDGNTVFWRTAMAIFWVVSLLTYIVLIFGGPLNNLPLFIGSGLAVLIGAGANINWSIFKRKPEVETPKQEES